MPTGRDFFKRYPLKIKDPSRPLKLVRHSEYLSKKLRWISLQGFSSEYLPNDFYIHDAIAINLKHSLLRFFWKKTQVFITCHFLLKLVFVSTYNYFIVFIFFSNILSKTLFLKVLTWLKVLNLSQSKCLIETPDFSRLPSLEQLILRDCPRLHTVHQSIGCLCYLILLNLKDCTSLCNLPSEIYMLKSLKTLILCGCPKIDLLEKDIVQMESLITLIAENTVVQQVPFSILSSKSIGYISLSGFEGLSHNLLPSIIRSRRSPTKDPLSYIHSFMDMENNSWDDIAPLLNNLANLRSVLVQCDPKFQLSKQVKTIMVEYGANITESGISKHHFRSSLTGVGRYNYKEFFNTVFDSIPEVLL